MNGFHNIKELSLILLLLTIAGTVTLRAKSIRLLGSRGRQPVELANVCFMKADSTMVSTVLTDSAGFFIVPDDPEIVLCRITAIGYNGLSTETSPLSDNQELLLEEKVTALSEVTVRGQRSPYTVKPDRIIFNPEFAAFATSAYDIVCAAPGVLEDNGTVSMPAKQGVRILINGKEQRGELKDVMTLLKSYQATDIKSVEVISAPSARYSRGNDIGVINIILRKRPSDYLGGSASYTLSAANRVSNSLSGALNYRMERLSASINAYGTLSPSKFRQTNELRYSDIVRTMHSSPIRHNNDLTFKATLDYNMSPKWDIALTYFQGTSDMRHREHERFEYLKEDEPAGSKEVVNRRHEKSTSHYAYAEANGRLNGRTTLSASLDYYWKSYPSTREEENMEDMLLVWQRNRVRSSNFTSHANLEMAVSKSLRLDFGADFLYTKSDSESAYFFIGEGELGNGFDYREYELDVYGQLQYSFAEKWFLSANMKYQYVKSGSVDTQEPTDHFSIGRSDLAPSVYLSYTLDQKNSFRLSYYYNTVKPAISALNPMILYMGNGTYRTGNPGLKDGRHFLLSFIYNFGTLSIEPYYEWLSDDIGETGRVDSDGNLIYSWANKTNMRTTALSVYWGWSGKKWLNLSVSQYLSHKHVFSTDPDAPLDRRFLYYALYPRIQFFPDSEKKFVLSLNGYYTSKSIKPDFVQAPNWNISASVLWRPDRQWTISLSGDNLLHSRTRGYQIMTGSRLYYNNRYVYPGLSLTISFVWGKSAKWRMENSTRRTLDERTRITD